MLIGQLWKMCENGQIPEAIWNVKLSKHLRKSEVSKRANIGGNLMCEIEQISEAAAAPQCVSRENACIWQLPSSHQHLHYNLQHQYHDYYDFTQDQYLSLLSISRWSRSFVNSQGLLCLTSILMNSQCLKISYCWTIVFTAFKGWFYIWIFYCTSTFKSNDSLSSTEEKP